MSETQKVRRHDKFRNKWSQYENKCKSHMGHDLVSGGVSVFCWLDIDTYEHFIDPKILIFMNTSWVLISSSSTLRH